MFKTMEISDSLSLYLSKNVTLRKNPQSPDRWLKEPRNNQVRPEERGNLNI